MTAQRTSASDPPLGTWRSVQGRQWLALFIPAAVLVGFRLHAFGSPLETDECNYVYIGSRLLADDALYEDVWDHQPPGVFVLFSAVVGVLGDSPVAIRSFATACALACMVLVYGCCRPALGAGVSWLAALLFALCSSDPGMAGEGCNRELYMNLLTLAGVYFLLHAGGKGENTPGSGPLRAGPVFAAGVMLGLASTFKTVVAAQWFLLLVAIWFAERAVAKRTIRQLIGVTLAFASGPALIWGLVTGYFALTGRFGLFVDAVFGFNVAYAGIGSGFVERFGEFFTHWPVFRTALPLWVAGAIGPVVLIARYRRGDARWTVTVLALAIGSYVAACLPGRFWPHYYLLMLPCLTLLSAAVVSGLGQVGAGGGARSGRSWPAKAFVVVLLGGLLVTQGLYYLLVPAEWIAYPRYRHRMVWARDQGRRVESVTDPQDSIYVWGIADAGVYYYSGRRCAARFPMITGLLGDDPKTRARQAQLIEDLTRNKPRLVLVAWEPFEALRRFFIDQRYVSAGPDRDRMEVLCAIDRPIDRIDWNWSPPAFP